MLKDNTGSLYAHARSTHSQTHRLVFGEYDIWFAGKVVYMKAVTEALGKQEFTDKDFRLGVGAPYPAHVVAPGCYVVYIGHSQRYSERLTFPNEMF